MAQLLRPGVFIELFGKMAIQAQLRTPMALDIVALAAEKQAKINASTGSHAYGTPTPASPGTGPAQISGTLVRSITHSTPMPHGLGWSAKVGTAAGMYPVYRTLAGGVVKSRTPSSKYGYYLEKGLRNGARYPFLEFAAGFAMRQVAGMVFKQWFSLPWG